MEQRRNKGFTLIELLVIIAVIAILVAILIPSVLKNVTRAAAAADAANLRSMSAKATTMFLQGEEVTEGMIHFTPPNTFEVVNGPSAKTEGFQNQPLTIIQDPSTLDIVAKYGSKDHYYFADIAETGRIPGSGVPSGSDHK